MLNSNTHSKPAAARHMPAAARQRPPKADAKAARLPAWRPQSSSLTRDEIRRIVIDMIG